MFPVRLPERLTPKKCKQKSMTVASRKKRDEEREPDGQAPTAPKPHSPNTPARKPSDEQHGRNTSTKLIEEQETNGAGECNDQTASGVTVSGSDRTEGAESDTAMPPASPSEPSMKLNRSVIPDDPAAGEYGNARRLVSSRSLRKPSAAADA